MALLSGCGQKGPLYLPDKNAAVVTAPAQPHEQRRADNAGRSARHCDAAGANTGHAEETGSDDSPSPQ